MSESLPPQTTSLRFDDLDADIALISSDSVRFNVRSGFLLGSSVFERMLAIKIGKLEKGSEVKLDETAATLELLLSFLVRGSERPALGYDKIKEALKLADKYDAPMMADVLVLELSAHSQSHPVEVFAYGAAYRNRAAMRIALTAFNKVSVTVKVPGVRVCSCKMVWYETEAPPRQSSCQHSYYNQLSFKGPSGLDSVAPELASRIPGDIYQRFEAQRTRIMQGETTWEDVALAW